MVEAAEMSWREIWMSIWGTLNYPLVTVGTQPMSLGKLLMGIFLLIIGYMLSQRGARTVERRVLTRFVQEDSLRYTLRRFIFFFFLFLSTLFTLGALNVPITIFTVFGGALAVGIGFGSQQVINNFISGILVLVERPIRVGDFVEVEGVTGQVVSIGIRATNIRTGTNSIVIIPNTVFIQGKLVNWTLAGSVGVAVRVGVSYQTDVKRFAQLAITTVGQIGDVLPGSATVIFQDFGDNALIFDVLFQISASSLINRRVIESEARFRLNDMFNAQKIEIPFPQRQIHWTPPEPGLT